MGQNKLAVPDMPGVEMTFISAAMAALEAVASGCDAASCSYGPHTYGAINAMVATAIFATLIVG